MLGSTGPGAGSAAGGSVVAMAIGDVAIDWSRMEGTAQASEA